MNIKLTLEYDGTDFSGFEIQPRKRTVRGKIDRETIIHMLNGGEGIPALAPASGLYLKEIIY